MAKEYFDSDMNAALGKLFDFSFEDDENQLAVETGIKPFDTLLGGGIPRSAQVVITGLPSTGKSALARAIAVSVARKNEGTVLFIDTAEGEERSAAKLLACYAGVPIAQVRNPELRVAGCGGLLSKAKELKSLPIAFRSIDMPMLQTVSDMAEEVDPALLVVDSADGICTTNPVDGLQSEVVLSGRTIVSTVCCASEEDMRCKTHWADEVVLVKALSETDLELTLVKSRHQNTFRAKTALVTIDPESLAVTCG